MTDAPNILRPAGEPRFPRTERTGLAFVALATTAYGALCWPSVIREDHAPQEALFFGMFGMKYLWVFITPLFMLAMPAGRARRAALAGFALVSAFIFGCTVLDVGPEVINGIHLNVIKPHPVIYAGVIFGAKVLPIHAVIVALEAWGMKRVSRPLTSRKHRLGIMSAIGIAAASFPFLYALTSNAYYERQGRLVADASWAAGNAPMCYEFNRRFHRVKNARGDRDIDIQMNRDAETGLMFADASPQRFVLGHNQRIRDLIAEKGLPPWSRKECVLTDAEIASAMDDPTFQKVDALPYEIGPDTVIARGYSLRRWGKEIAGRTEFGPNHTWIARRERGNDPGDHGDPSGSDVYVGTLPNRPDILLVRMSPAHLQVWTRDGECIQEASVIEDLGFASPSAP